MAWLPYHKYSSDLRYPPNVFGPTPYTTPDLALPPMASLPYASLHSLPIDHHPVSSPYGSYVDRMASLGMNPFSSFRRYRAASDYESCALVTDDPIEERELVSNMLHPSNNIVTRKSIVALIAIYNGRREAHHDPIQIESSTEADIAIGSAIAHFLVCQRALEEAKNRQDNLMNTLYSAGFDLNEDLEKVERASELLKVASELYKLQEEWFLDDVLAEGKTLGALAELEPKSKHVGQSDLMKQVEELLDDATQLLIKNKESECGGKEYIEKLEAQEEGPEVVSAEVETSKSNEKSKGKAVEANQS
ncbi:hypothetical protein BKA65DRAFT_474035 [Rhexocercosporidium sp. MPI-PUGE-AT-0058]|nr:hypothetical protein BKA65DRAFT_474035 [Rhexocercosporidium sp. MPI-PUGE-AT-0058]